MITIVHNGYEYILRLDGQEIGSVDLMTVELLSAILGFEFEVVEQ